MNEKIKQEIDEKRDEFVCAFIHKYRPDHNFIPEDLEFAYSKGDKDGYNRAVEDCIKEVGYMAKPQDDKYGMAIYDIDVEDLITKLKKLKGE